MTRRSVKRSPIRPNALTEPCRDHGRRVMAGWCYLAVGGVGLGTLAGVDQPCCTRGPVLTIMGGGRRRRHVVTVEARGPARTLVTTSLLWLEAVLAIGAYAGATGLVLAGRQMIGDAAGDLPFASPVFGGIALAIVNGLLPTVVVVAELRGARWAAAGHLLVGTALVAWIVVQVAFLGWPPHWLQLIYFVYGWVIVGLAMIARGRATTPGPRG